MEPNMRNQTSHPYASLEGSPLWEAIEQAIASLVANQDIAEQTPRHYIVGFICKGVSEYIKKEQGI
jgi:hypothetical protein